MVDDLGTGIARAIGGGGGRAAAAETTTRGGVYISDNAGASWKLVNSENRLWGSGWYFEAVTVDPTNPHRAYVINTATYMTTDGGKSFLPFTHHRGAPGSDDYLATLGQSQGRQSHGAQQRSGYGG